MRQLDPKQRGKKVRDFGPCVVAEIYSLFLDVLSVIACLMLQDSRAKVFAWPY